MATTNAPSSLRLTLLPNDVLPEGLIWRIQDGYIRTTTWDQEGESLTLGLWGPGDLVSNLHSALDPVEVQCLSTVVVEQVHPNEAETLALLRQQIRNTEEIFEINRIRSAERRLLRQGQPAGGAPRKDPGLLGAAGPFRCCSPEQRCGLRGCARAAGRPPGRPPG